MGDYPVERDNHGNSASGHRADYSASGTCKTRRNDGGKRLSRGYLAEAQERELHPDADDREIFLRVVARRLDRDTMKRVYGWSPDGAK